MRSLLAITAGLFIAAAQSDTVKNPVGPTRGSSRFNAQSRGQHVDGRP